MRKSKKKSKKKGVKERQVFAKPQRDHGTKRDKQRKQERKDKIARRQFFAQ